MRGFRTPILFFIALLIALPAPVSALCLDPVGDVTGSGETDVMDVQCTILTVLNAVVFGLDAEPPVCLAGSTDRADITCDAAVNVVDVVVSISLALGLPLSEQIDADGNGCPDSCITIEICDNGTDDDLDGDEDCYDEDCYDASACADVMICGNGTCDTGEDCMGCSADCGCVETSGLCFNQQCSPVGLFGGGPTCLEYPVLCNDDNPCTDDTCVEGTGCIFTPATGECDDGFECTFDDVCAGGECAGDLVDCNDGNPCTIDTCFEDKTCGHSPAGGAPKSHPPISCQSWGGGSSCSFWSPTQIVVNAGDTVNWDWEENHSVIETAGYGSSANPVPGGFTSGAPVLNGSFSLIIDTPGFYYFQSSANSAMYGMIYVKSSPTVACEDGNECTDEGVCMLDECIAGADLCE